MKLKIEDLPVTREVTSLYTNIPHNEGIATIYQTLDEASTNPLEKMFTCRLINQVLTKIILKSTQNYRNNTWAQQWAQEWSHHMLKCLRNTKRKIY